MKLRKQIATRIALGLALLLVAALVTIFINNALAQREPENSLPTMDVYYNVEKGDRLPEDHIRRDRYTWQFLFWTREGGGLDLEVWRNIRPGLVQSGSPLELVFSVPPDSYDVSIMTGEGGNFIELGGTLTTPSEAGTYTYRVEAVWSENRRVEYYFRIEVPW